MNWNASYENNRDYMWFTTASLSRLLNFAKLGDADLSALDVGCGTGQLVRDLCHRGFSAKGIDTSSSAIEIAKNSTVLGGDKVSFEVFDLSSDLLPEKFDLITCKYVLPFIEQKDKFLQNVSSMLKSEKSCFVLITPDPDTLPEAKKNIAMSRNDILNLLEKYFSKVEEYAERGDFWYICKKKTGND